MDDPYLKVPKELSENLKWRREAVAAGCSDSDSAHELWILCKRSPLFYFNTFGWLHEPRPKRARCAVIPFITWPYQDKAILKILDAIRSGYDLCAYKSRDMGASWIFLYCFEYLWHFEHNLALGLVSRNEKYVDDPGNMKALFQKIDFIHERLPKFLMPAKYRISMHLENCETGSTIDGESTTGKVARGDRRSAILLDEFDAFENSDGFAALGSTQFATDCRLFNSTFESTAGAFYKVYTNDEVQKLPLPWWDHPLYGKDQYLDANGKRRSPWYDQQCKKADDVRIIARELDMNPEGAQSQFFEQTELEKLIGKCCPPVVEGELSFDQDSALSPLFLNRLGGRLKLWMSVTDDGKPAMRETDQFSMGVDIATGTGATPSALSVSNRMTGQKVAEWVDSKIRPDQLGKVAVALARWFNEALIVPEANGPGRNFIDCIIDDLRYGNVYYRQNIRAVDKKITTSAGWFSTPESKWELFGEYRRALVAGHFVNLSGRSLKECQNYVFYGNSIWHASAVKSNDESISKHNHGDIPTADALSWKGCRYSPVSSPDAEPYRIPPNSIGGRRAAWAKKQREKELQWQ